MMARLPMFVMQSTIVGQIISTILNAQFISEYSLILGVSTNAIDVCILASILPCNLVKYLILAHIFISPMHD